MRLDLASDFEAFLFIAAVVALSGYVLDIYVLMIVTRHTTNKYVIYFHIRVYYWLYLEIINELFDVRFLCYN